MKKLIATTAAAGVLVAGAFVASTVTSEPALAQASETPAVEQQARPDRPVRGEIFDSVLEGLVDDGTIDSGQADAIKEAFATKRAEMEEKFGPFPRGGHARDRGILRGLLADDVITQAEIDSLPEDHPLRTGESPLSELLEDDGQITRAELEAFREANRPNAPGNGNVGG